jgi:hypothetical protein
MGWATSWAIFFTNPTGHPGTDVDNDFKNTFAEKWHFLNQYISNLCKKPDRSIHFQEWYARNWEKSLKIMIKTSTPYPYPETGVCLPPPSAR